VGVATLGCVLTPSKEKGGAVITRVYRSDPDEPGRTAPIARPTVAAGEGDIIESIDGVAVLSVPDPSALLRNKAGKQVLLRIRPGSGGEARDAIAVPMSAAADADLRYHDWEYSRRQRVEQLGDGQIGYLHLRAMGGGDFEDFVKGYYPVFNRPGLIIDVRHNRGGNIDSWVLGKLMRKAWMTWSQRVGQAPLWNMQYAFRGHMVILCDEATASDGEAVSEGFRRLGLGKVLGTRTWGGEIWLSSSNVLVDKGIATAAEFGVWGPEGDWLVEGRGVEPDIVVDNPPHATFKGADAQLQAAVDHLKKLIAEKPVPPITRPPFPDKSFRNK
jgi:tricorn protease